MLVEVTHSPTSCAAATVAGALHALPYSSLQLLPGGSREVYEMWADLGELLLKGGPGEQQVVFIYVIYFIITCCQRVLLTGM